MIITVGAGPCACPVRNAISQGSADMSPPGQGNHGGIAPTILTGYDSYGLVLQGFTIRRGIGKILFLSEIPVVHNRNGYDGSVRQRPARFSKPRRSHRSESLRSGSSSHSPAKARQDAFHTGKISMNALPSPGRLSASTVPLWCSMMPYSVESPSPTPYPSFLVVKNGSKI